MPMINGKFYMNPLLGAALEEARARSAPANALEERNGEINAAEPGLSPTDGNAPGSLHRVEIEAANGGFLARLQRHPVAGAATTNGNGTMPGEIAIVERQTGNLPAHEEVHVFSHHQDLLDFLKQQFMKEA